MPKRSRLKRGIRVVVEKTGEKVEVQDFGEKFHPRFWSKTTGYDAKELRLAK